MNLLGRLARRGGVIGLVVLAALAYIPALLSSPGGMPADTKLYLYLDPRRLVADSIWSFDDRQFGGWVPHQMIAYAWPSGPWYVVMQAIGLPDWVAHRLWIGTILFAAGAGVMWAARRLGLSLPAALAAGLVYELSPYLVPYVSRTSSMLLPWAGLGWVVGLTIGATTRTKWRDAALCALVVGSVAGVNATALVMVAPAPVLWLVVAVVERAVTWRRAVVAALRIGGLSMATSLWWFVMLLVQSRHGADLLAYSESLEDVSFTATSVEVWRSLGYWLTYIRDGYAPTTTAGAEYMEAGWPLVLGFLLVVVALVGLAAVRFRARRYALVVTFVGVVLAVGVHPFADPSPIARLVRGDGQDGLALALRSSARALPLLSIVLGLGAGALIDALGRWRRLVRAGAAALVGLIALGNNPVVTGNAFVDPALEREQYPPDSWYAAAAALDAMPDGYRVLQLPGAEFGAFTWGYTVDPPLPGMTTRPLVTRDLLPLGSPSAMDLLYALDDRFQSGRVEVDSIAPVARLLGADTIWVTGDAAFDRFRTPRPELTSELYAGAGEDAGLGEPVGHGRPVVNVPTVPMVDEQSLSEPLVSTPVPPVELVPVLDPVPVVRASDDVVLVSGSGDGLVDAAAAGLIDGDEAILYSASLSGDELISAARQAGAIIVTDSNRRRSHHWRGSQDVTGYTETGAGRPVLWNDSGDARLEVFPGAPLSASTLSRSEGEVTAVATGYGARFEYHPEARAALAIDGDPNTAWTVLDHPNQVIELRTESGVDHVTLLQPNGLEPVRHLRDVTIAIDGGEPIPVTLDDRSLVAGQQVAFPATDGPTTVRIRLGSVVSADRSGRPDRTGVGFAEIDLGLGASPEVITVPRDLTGAMAEEGIDRPVTYVLTRERVRATNRWRSDPEWRIVRLIDVPAAEDVAIGVDVRLDLRAGDAVLAGLLGIDGPTASARLTGAPSAAGWMAADGDPATAWVTPFNRVRGAALTVRLVAPGEPMTIHQRLGNYTRITSVLMTQGDRTVLVPVPTPDASGGSTIVAPAEFEPGATRIAIVGTLERTTRDRRFADTVLMPAAITEITNVEPAVLPTSFATDCRDDLLSIDGAGIPVRVRGNLADAFDGDQLEATLCDPGPVALTAGEHRVAGPDDRRTGLQVDRVVLDAGSGTRGGSGSAAADGEAPPTATVTSRSRLGRDVTVDNCGEGCWLILGEGFHDAWSASTDAGSLGEPQLVSGGFNGWWIPASDGPVAVHLSWTAQRPLTAALVASVLAAVACLVLVVRDRVRTPAPRRTPADDVRWRPLGSSDGIRRSAAAAAAWTLLTVLFVSTEHLWWGVLGGLAIVLTRRIRVAAWFAVAGMVRIAVDVITVVWREHPLAWPGFPGHWEHLHRFGLFVAVSVLVSAGARHHHPHHDESGFSTGQIRQKRQLWPVEIRSRAHAPAVGGARRVS